MSRHNKHTSQAGYIALISALVISAVLIVISVALSTTVFFSRFNVLGMEYKQRSSNLAEGCIQAELLRLAQNINDATIGNLNIGSESCSVVSVKHDSPQPGQITIQSKAAVNKAVSNIQVITDKNNLSIISWQELSSL